MLRAPAAVAVRVAGDADHLRAGRLRAVVRVQCIGEIGPIESEHHVRLGDEIARRRRQVAEHRRHRMQPMIGGKCRGEAEMREHRRIEPLGQRDARLPFVQAARAAPHQDDGTARASDSSFAAAAASSGAGYAGGGTG